MKDGMKDDLKARKTDEAAKDGLRLVLSSFLGLALLLGTASPLTAQRVRGTPYGGEPRYVSSRVWVPGGYELVPQRVWVPGRVERVWVAPSFEWRAGPCGTRFRVQIGSGFWRTVHHPGHYETRTVRVERPGRWVARGSCLR